MKKESDKRIQGKKDNVAKELMNGKDNIRDEFREIFSKIPEVGLDGILDSAKDLNSLVGYITDCRPEVKREISVEFISHIEKVAEIYRKFEPLDDITENHVVMNNMDLEISHLKESIKDFSENKIQLSEFFEIIFYCNASIADNIEAHSLPESLHNLIISFLKELRLIELKVLQLKMLSYE